MKIAKFLKTTLAVVMALAANAATACQFGDVVPPVAAWMRYIYISGVNEPNNRIYEVSAPRARSYNVTIYPDNGTSYDASLECFDLSVRGKSEVTVDLPLTVYIAATERTLFHPGATGDDAPPQLQTADDARLTLYLQYRALPSLTWVTAATVRMETWQISALGTTGKPVFGSYTIDPRNLADQRAGNHRKTCVRFLYDRPSCRSRDPNPDSNLYHCGGKERSSGTSRGPRNRRGISRLPD